MNRRTLISVAVGALGPALVLLAGAGAGRAQQSDVDKIKAAIEAYHAAISALDITKMEPLWAHDSYVMAIQPRTKSIAVGWDEVRKAWEGTFGFWSELKVSQKGESHIHIEGSTAWADGIASVSGKAKTGETVSEVSTFETDIFEKRGDAWLIVSHAAWRAPQ
jgi:ketosteroid isomerase-like protein